MKIKYPVFLLAILALGVGAFLAVRNPESSPHGDVSATIVPPISSVPAHSNGQEARVPAYQSASQASELPATLPAAQFVGKSRDAYEVARKIPKTLAQLPCYCECDRGFGHKSLHSCFEDDHASHCAVCVDEALLAYRLEKEDKLTAEQVRQKIIEQYSGSHGAH